MSHQVATQLQITDVSSGYSGREVLHRLSLPSIEAGQVTAFVGPNGAGKTTLLRVLAGLLPSRGTVQLGGNDLLRMPADERARLMAFMPQFMPQHLSLSVLESMISTLRVSDVRWHHLNTAGVRDIALGVLERLEIADLSLTPIGHLSGGQRQLASLAQAVVREPNLLLLDEPISALDLRHQIEVMKTVRRVAQEGAIVVVVLHDLQVAAKWADIIVVLKDGILYSSGPPSKIINSQMLRDVYGVEATIEMVSGGEIHIRTESLPISEFTRA